jgi:hypothetical protein
VSVRDNDDRSPSASDAKPLIRLTFQGKHSAFETNTENLQLKQKSLKYSLHLIQAYIKDEQ